MDNFQDPNDIRAQLLASLQARMASVPAPDTSEGDAEAQRLQGLSSLARAGQQLGGAILGRSTNGDNQFSKSMDQDSARLLASGLEQKRMAFEADKRREELRNGLSTRFVDDMNLRERSAESDKQKDLDYDRKLKDDRADQSAMFKQQKDLAAMSKKDGNTAQAETRQKIANDKSQQSLGKDLSPLQDTLNAIGEVEAAMGGPLEKFSYDTKGNAVKDGAKVDLPGVNIPGFGSTSFFSQEARNLDDTMARVFNQTLKVRSGAAVTDNELARLRAEFSAGKFNTEAEKVKALQDVKRLLKDSFNNTEAKYNGDVVDEYKTRGGQTSSDVVAPGRPGQETAAPKKQYSPSRNQTRFTYPDGRVEIKDGKL